MSTTLEQVSAKHAIFNSNTNLVPGKHYVCTQRDESLFPILRPGDKVVIDIDANIQPGDLICFEYNGQVLMRYLQLRNKVIILKSLNKVKYPDIIADPQHLDYLGKCTSFQREL